MSVGSQRSFLEQHGSVDVPTRNAGGIVECGVDDGDASFEASVIVRSRPGFRAVEACSGVQNHAAGDAIKPNVFRDDCLSRIDDVNSSGGQMGEAFFEGGCDHGGRLDRIADVRWGAWWTDRA